MARAGSSDTRGLETAFDGILREYGTNVAQISTIVAVVIGSLGFSDYFNAGSWTLTAVFCFGLAYMYRRQTPTNLITTSIALTIFLGLVAVLPATILLRRYGMEGLASNLATHKAAFSAYASFIITISIAVLITSYKKQELYAGGNFPDKIQQYVADNIYQCPFYREKMAYDVRIIDFNSQDGSILAETTLSYVVTNRFKEPAEYPVVYVFNDGEVTEAVLNKRKYDIRSREYTYGRGIRISEKIPPAGSWPVVIKMRERLNVRTSELYTTHHPATDLRLGVTNPFPELSIDFELLYPEKTVPATNGDYREIVLNKGLLPYQGIKVNWAAGTKELHNG